MKRVFEPAKPKKGQKEYYDSIKENEITLCTGKAGTGKTFLALSAGIEMLFNKAYNIRRIIVVRPYIQTNIGEKLGALPGDLKEKVGPYIEGIKDNLRELIHDEGEINKLINDRFEFTVLSMCRGRSFNNAFIIVEEAQNVPLDGDAMKMILTRLGKSSKMVIAGDLDQCDIPSENSGLVQALNILDDVPGVGVVEMEDLRFIYRNPIIAEILKRYQETF